MPLYEYWCPVCKDTFTERHPMDKKIPSIVTCPWCGQLSKRTLRMPSVHWKCQGGTGAGRKGEGRIDHFRHKDGSPLTSVDEQPEHVGD
jgi:putative FmdB family regulatory protein